MTAVVLVGALVAAILLGAAVGVLVVGRVRRLHLLHVRTDAARAGLDAALRRRAAVARRLGLTAADLPDPGSVGSGPVGSGSAGSGAWGAAREAAENALGRRLAALDRAALPGPLRAELADAERLVVLGRRVHNDAVRDTLDLRSRRTVRWLRLHGTAPLPAYVEIADPDTVIPDATGIGARRTDVASDDRR